MEIFQVKDVAQVWHKLCKYLISNPNLVPKAGATSRSGGGYNFRGDYYIHIYDLFFEINSSKCPGLFLEDMGYSSKGTKIINLLGKYLDVEWTNKWINFITTVAQKSPDVAGDIILNTKLQKKRAMPGGCLTSFVYRGTPIPSLTVISRAIEMPTKGLADVLLISAICKLLCDRLGVKDMPVRWFFTSAWTRTRTCFYYVIYKWPEKVKFRNKLFQSYIDKGWNKYYLTDYQFSYSANKRAKAYYLSKKSGKWKREIGTDKFYQVLEEFLK